MHSARFTSLFHSLGGGCASNQLFIAELAWHSRRFTRMKCPGCLRQSQNISFQRCINALGTTPLLPLTLRSFFAHFFDAEFAVVKRLEVWSEGDSTPLLCTYTMHWSWLCTPCEATPPHWRHFIHFPEVYSTPLNLNVLALPKATRTFHSSETSGVPSQLR